jgi:hypothetical protein
MFVERENVPKYSPRMTNYFIQKIENKRREKSLREMNEKKELYKIKKFLGVESKLKESLKNFKTYLPSIFKHKKESNSVNLEGLISKVENEIRYLDNTTV